MTTQTLQSAGTSSMPRVNLMPPEIAEAAKFRQIQFMLGGVVVVAIAIVGLLYYQEHSGLSDAKSQLAQAQQQESALQTKLASLAAVKATFADVAAKQAELAGAMGQEVRWSFILNDLSFRIPTNVWLTSMQVTEAPPTAPASTGSLSSATGSAAAAAPTPIGSLSFNGVGFKHDDVAAWLDALTREKSFVNPLFTNSQEAVIGTRPVVNFTTSVTLTSAALSHRYDVTNTTATGTTGTTTP